MLVAKWVELVGIVHTVVSVAIPNFYSLMVS